MDVYHPLSPVMNRPLLVCSRHTKGTHLGTRFLPTADICQHGSSPVCYILAIIFMLCTYKQERYTYRLGNRPFISCWRIKCDTTVDLAWRDRKMYVLCCSVYIMCVIMKNKFLEEPANEWFWCPVERCGAPLTTRNWKSGRHLDQCRVQNCLDHFQDSVELS